MIGLEWEDNVNGEEETRHVSLFREMGYKDTIEAAEMFNTLML